MSIIRTQSITKRFGGTTALDAISLQVNEGEIYGFIGLNGAGKTTLIRILLGMIQADSGQASLFGQQLTANFDRWNEVGYFVETPRGYPNLSVLENLHVFYKLRRLDEPHLITEVIERLKLNAYRNVKAKHLSMGNQQRLGLAKALLHKPKLLILDEPTNGLDPEGIVEVRELLQELVAQGSTVFLSSHILGEISKIADHLAIIHQGKLIKELTAEMLKKQLVQKILVQTSDNEKAVHLLAADFQVKLTSEEIEITDPKAIAQPELIAQLLVEKGLPPKQLYRFTEDLEHYFLRIIRN